MNEKPTIYLSNWSSSRTPGHHGPGRKLTIMAKPRHWEHGEGEAIWFVPSPIDLEEYKETGDIDTYRERFESKNLLRSIESMFPPSDSPISPGNLEFISPKFESENRTDHLVESGDTLCCSCSRKDASDGKCHRAWIAPFLHRAGWRVILDGVEWKP